MRKTRLDRLDQIAKDGAFDALVVGGGINGIGVFRELALQGLRVLLVEKSDYCSGCSSAPSRMIHGGLRYLENAEFSLVNESLQERDRLLANAPHLVQPLPTTIPIVGLLSGLWNSAIGFLGGGGKPSNRGAVPIKLGLTVYDWLTRRRRALPKHSFRGRQATRKLWPNLDPRVKFSATYYDAWISHPERLGIELIADAEAASKASVALNYATVERTANGLVVVDGANEHRIDVAADVIVNATGAWLDDTKPQLAGAAEPMERLIEGTKGSHLVIDNDALLDALGGHMLYYENADGRVCIVFPYLGRVLVGATDIRVDDVTRVRCEDDERDYILASLRMLLPDIPIDASQIVFSFSGIRPLPRSDHAFTGRISRGHFVRRIGGASPQICMVGGKWTTFRAFAEQACDAALAEIGASRRLSSAKLPIGGGKNFPAERNDLIRDFENRFDITTERARHLVDHYGTLGEQVQSFCSGRQGDMPLVPGCPYTRAEIDYLAVEEQVVHLGDIILRRTDLAITGQLSGDLVDAVLDVLGVALGWTSDRVESEQKNFVADMDNYYGVSLALERRQTDRRKECA